MRKIARGLVCICFLAAVPVVGRERMPDARTAVRLAAASCRKGGDATASIAKRFGRSRAELSRSLWRFNLNSEHPRRWCDLSLAEMRHVLATASEEDEEKAEEAREEWLRRTLGDEDGSIPPDAMSRRLEQPQSLLRAQSVVGVSAIAGLPSTIGGWTNIATYNHPVGRINDLLIHPTSTNTMWAGTDGGGIWKTTDGGTTWTAANDFLASLSISSFAMRPGDPATIYAATGPFQSHTGLPGVGIYKSTDGGNNWSLLANTSPSVNGDFYNVNQLAIHPTDSNTVIAATRFGAYITTNGGGVWTKIAGTTTQVNGVAIHPANANLRVLALQDGTVKVATDGATYNPYTISASANSYMKIALAPSNQAVMYALSMTGSSTGLYRSATTGTSWSPVTPPTSPSQALRGQLYYTGGLWIDPANANHIAVAEFWAGVTTDASAPTPVWNEPNSGWVDFHGIVGHPSYNGTSNKIVYFFDDGGLYKFNDVDLVASTSPTFLSPNGIVATEVYTVAGRGGTMIFGAQDVASRFYQPLDASPKWKFAAGLGGHDGAATAADPLDTNTVYGSTQYLSIHRSKDGGANTGFICQGITDITCGGFAGSASFIAPFVLDPNNRERMYAGAAQLWRSNNVYTGAPPTWSVIHTGVGSNIAAIAVAEGNPDHVWIAYNTGAVYKSTNATTGSPTFTQVTTVPAGFKNCIFIDRTNPLRVFIGLSGFIANRVYLTPDGGTTWNPSATGLPNAPVFSIQQHPVNASFMYAGNAFGLYASSDGGANWNSSNQGPANVMVRDIKWYTDSPAVILLGTMGRGVWRATVAASASLAVPTNVVATAASTTSVSLTWTASAGATGYKIFRSSVFPASFTQVGTSGTTNFTDNTGLTANTSYLYIVRATDGASDSADSNVDLATTVIFTDATLTPGTTKVKTAHVTELRTAVNAVRTLASLSAVSYTDPALSTSINVKRLHVIDLRTALDAARTALGLSAVTYTDSTITAGVTTVKAAHVNDLRNGVK